MRTASRFLAFSGATALTLVLAACGGNDSGSMSGMDMGTSSSTTSSSTTSAAPSSSASVEAEHNDQDVMFAQMMIVHHQGAIDMAQMATTNASSQEVKDLAATIQGAQQPEIDQMTSWLTAWGAPPTPDPSMSMPGMEMGSDSSMMGMSEEQMTQLQNATGADFDRMFLQMMIEHHKSAVQMAETEQQDGLNTQALELADSIVASQNAEIDQMNQMLTAMG